MIEGLTLAVVPKGPDRFLVGFINDDGSTEACAQFDLEGMVAARQLIDDAIQEAISEETKQ